MSLQGSYKGPSTVDICVFETTNYKKQQILMLSELPRARERSDWQEEQKIILDLISPQALLQGGHQFPRCDDEARLHRQDCGQPHRQA